MIESLKETAPDIPAVLPRPAGAAFAVPPTAFRRWLGRLLMWLVRWHHQFRVWFRRAMKRLMDIVVSGALLVLLSPLLIGTALAILITDGRPVLFKQRRVGKDGRIFKMWKFRTMRKRSELVENISAHQHKIEDSTGCFEDPKHETVKKLVHTLKNYSRSVKYPPDARILPFGKFIRKYSIDELPQLFEVLTGDMSLVGPRPFVLYEVANFSPRALLRHKMKPGLSGLWQISNRNLLKQDESLSLDLEYVARHSLRLDLMILLKTIPAALKNRGGN